MMRPLSIGAIILAMWAALAPAMAQDRERLGVTRLFNNDVIGDGRDRWRTGSYGISVFAGPEWTGELPARFGDLIEIRFRGEVITPEGLQNPAPDDRLFAGTWWLGAHTHFDLAGFETTAGLDLALTGEQTGLRAFQDNLHETLGFIDTDLADFEVDNNLFLHGTLEVARDLRNDIGAIRPFVELQAGVEDIARIGVDVTLGGLGRGGLRVRDPITGHRLAAISGDDRGLSLLLGGDFAYVGGSEYFPGNGLAEVSPTRSRLRAGVNYAFERVNLFYGATYLSEEFETQPEGQVVGSLSLQIRF